MSSEPLIDQIDALLDLDARGKLVPHGVGGLARELLTRCRDRLSVSEEMVTRACTGIIFEDMGSVWSEMCRTALKEEK